MVAYIRTGMTIKIPIHWMHSHRRAIKYLLIFVAAEDATAAVMLDLEIVLCVEERNMRAKINMCVR